MADNVDIYLSVIDRLEPELTPIDTPAALVSIAISLKRIADHFEREDQQKAEAKIVRRDRNTRLADL